MVYIISMKSITKLNLCKPQYFVCVPSSYTDIFILSGKFQINVCVVFFDVSIMVLYLYHFLDKSNLIVYGSYLGYFQAMEVL